MAVGQIVKRKNNLTMDPLNEDTEFRNWITPDGSPGETGVGGFKAESDRYHLYVSLACPWAHRTLIFRKLKKIFSPT